MDETLDTAPCGFLTFDEEGAIVRANRTLLDMLGYARPDLDGLKVETILTVANRIFYQTHFFPMLALHGKAEEIFLKLRTRGGEDVPVLANAARRAGTEELYDCVFIPVHHRRKYEDEILGAKRAAERALQTNEVLVGAKRELEERTRELDRKIRRLEQKHGELMRVNRILSHDLREPLRKISLFMDMLVQEDGEHLSPGGRRSIEKVNAATSRIDRLLRTLQQYLSLDAGDQPVTDVDLNAQLDWAARQVRESSGRPLTLHRDDLPVVEGFEAQLEALFFNLLDNAVKFGRPGFTPEVNVECAVIQANRFASIEGRYAYVDFARIVVADNGVGFDQKYGEYVFEMLTKLDRTSPGLGYGLAICKKVVENHYGSITVESRPGLGSRFTVLLPLKH